MRKLRESLSHGLLALFVFVTVGALFSPALTFQFLNFDDPQYLVHNPMVQRGFSSATVQWALTDTSTGHWHPLTWLVHTGAVSLFGLDAWGHHLLNIILHGANASLVLLIVGSLTGAWGRAVVVALLFGAHPLRIESVAWASQLKDVLSAFFALLALYCWVHALHTRGRATRAGALLLYALSLLAKPTWITLPLLLVLLDFWPLARLSRRNALEKWPFALIAFFGGVAVIWAQSAGAGLRSLSEISIADRLNGAPIHLLSYLGRFFQPLDQGIFYPFTEFPPGAGVGACIAIAATTLLAWQARRSHPYLLWGWGWFVIAAAPTIGIIQVGGQSIADRWSYLPHLGLSIGMVWFFANTVQGGVRWALALTAPIACATLTLRALPHWRNSESVFRETLAVSPHNFLAHNNLGVALDGDGRLADALSEFEEAARLNPTYPEALNNLGTAYARTGRLTEALSLFRRALAIRPNFKEARYHLGLALFESHDYLGAAHEWIAVLVEAPHFSAAANSLELLVVRGLFTPCASSVDPRELRAKMMANLQRWAPASERQSLHDTLLRSLRCE